jgi:hypothetical protein
MIISVIAGLVTAFSVYQGCHAVDTMIQTKKAAKDVANDMSFDDDFIDDDDDFIDDDFIIENPVVADNSEDSGDDNCNNCDDGNSSGEQPPAQQPRNSKGQFTKK